MHEEQVAEKETRFTTWVLAISLENHACWSIRFWSDWFACDLRPRASPVQSLHELVLDWLGCSFHSIVFDSYFLVPLSLLSTFLSPAMTRPGYTFGGYGAASALSDPSLNLRKHFSIVQWNLSNLKNTLAKTHSFQLKICRVSTMQN